MNLYLVQHAKAKSKEEDPERPLSEAGYADIRHIAAYIAAHTPIKLHQIFHSGKTRARQTAEVLAEAIRPVEGIHEAPGLKALDDPYVWVDRLAETDEDMMLVGHKPYMPKLAALLLCQDENKQVVEFEQGGVVCLGRDVEKRWSVHWIVIPQIIGKE